MTEQIPNWAQGLRTVTSESTPATPTPATVTLDCEAEEPIDRLREHLITGWIGALRTGAAESGGTPADERILRANDSFVRWVEEAPEVILRKWDVERQKMWPKSTANSVQAAWSSAADGAVKLIFWLASNGGHATPDHRVTLEELELCEHYGGLNESEKWVARYAVANWQRQNVDGSWYLTNRGEGS